MLYSGILPHAQKAALQRRGMYMPAGLHSVHTAAVFELPFMVAHPLHNYSGRSGGFSYSHSKLRAARSIGRYCSLSWNVVFGGAEHPTTWISTSGFSYNPGFIWADFCKATGEDFKVHKLKREGTKRGPITIGNDVWIGQGALLRAGVTIGDGAVIGANTVVTKDVAPFTIVAGNPARVIRQRFGDALIERIQRVRWWQYKFTDFNGLTLEEPERFLDELEERIARDGIQPYQPAILTGAELGAMLTPAPPGRHAAPAADEESD